MLEEVIASSEFEALSRVRLSQDPLGRDHDRG